MSRKPWYEREQFWHAAMPLLFAKDRLNAAKGQVDSITALLKLKPGSRILDLCCGVGRHSLELARRGFKVTGVDRNRAYLKEAHRRSRAERLDVELVRSDMRRFVRPKAFDAAINMFTSFGYFAKPEHDALVARHVCRSLVKGGRFLIDVHGKDRLLACSGLTAGMRKPATR